jgi:hypothetical protein
LTVTSLIIHNSKVIKIPFGGYFSWRWADR